MSRLIPRVRPMEVSECENLNRLSISRMSLATGDDESPTLLSMVVSGPAT